MDKSGNENMYLDQQNETVICAANCFFGAAGEGVCAILGSGCDAELVIGPEAQTVSGLTPIIAQVNQGAFAGDVSNEIFFVTNSNGQLCNYRVALDGGMLDITNEGIQTNQPALVSGETHLCAAHLRKRRLVGPRRATEGRIGESLCPVCQKIGR